MFKMKLPFCVILFVSFVAVLVLGSSESESKSESDPSKKTEYSLVLQRLDAQELRIQELEKSHEELKEKFQKQVDELKEQMREDHGLWLLTPPLRGPPGKDGKPGKDGEAGPKGERGFSALQSISSCSVAMETLSSLRSKKQRIYPHGNQTSMDVLCDFEVDGGGWTIIQKRTSGPKEEFQKNWIEYKNGFGSLQGNFWLGLDNIHALTKNGDQELRIQLEDFEGEKKWAKYSNFSISGASDSYRLALSGFYENSTAGDSMKYRIGSRFSTKDQDNDNGKYNCAVEWGGGGGWWFDRGCMECNLNGLYFATGETVPYQQGIYWVSWKGNSHSFAKTEIKIRQRK